MLQCLYEVGRYHKMTLLDLYCEMVKLEPLISVATDLNPVEKDYSTSVKNHQSHGSLQDQGYVVRAFQMLR